MNRSQRWIIPTAIAAGVAVLGWMFVGLDKRAQKYEMDHESGGAFDAEVSPVERFDLREDADGTSDGEQGHAWVPRTAADGATKGLKKAMDLVRKPGKRRDGLAALESLASAGYHDAMLELGKAYMDERFSSYAPDKAYAWLTVAQAFGSESAAERREKVASTLEPDDLEAAHDRAGALLASLKQRIGKDER